MKDIILKSYVEKFDVDNGLGGGQIERSFQYFSTAMFLHKLQLADRQDYTEMDVDGQNDAGIDMIAIFINDHLVTDVSDVEHFVGTGKAIEVKFVFVQAKTSDSIEVATLLRFYAGVKDYFSDEHKYPFNEALEEYYNIKNHIFRNAFIFKEYPEVHVVYATTSERGPQADQIAAQADSEVLLNNMKLFSKIEHHFIGSEELRSTYEDMLRDNQASIEMDGEIAFPQINGVSDAVVGTVKSSEFIKLLEKNGVLNRDVFYENVRDFQGMNEVNLEINETVVNDVTRRWFPLMNNGITLVAKTLRIIGRVAHLEGYQIVNGCQTSNILYQNRDVSNKGDFLVPVKIIASDDSDIIGSVIRAANRQTEVKVEAFESLSRFHKKLESYYEIKRMEKGVELYYERRSKQYAYSDISRLNIITMPQLAKAAVAIFDNEPHSDHQYYGAILKEKRRKLFLDSHKSDPYFICGLLILKVSKYMYNSDKQLTKYRPQIMMLVRMMLGDGRVPPFNSRKIAEYCKVLEDKIMNDDILNKAINDSIRIIQRELDSYDESARPWRYKAFTAEIISYVDGSNDKIQLIDECGTIDWFSLEKGYGVVISDLDGRSLFVKYDWFANYDYAVAAKGKRVKYVRSRSLDKDIAMDVVLIS
ncbi:AIPR family protein [bacterium]|nr:AIPR family protein [bacterium]